MSEPTVQERFDDVSTWRVLSTRNFSHCGLDVEEEIVSIAPGVNKLVWSLGLNAMVVDGRPNPFVHIDFAPDRFLESINTASARHEVMEKFDKVHGLAESKS